MENGSQVELVDSFRRIKDLKRQNQILRLENEI